MRPISPLWFRAALQLLVGAAVLACDPSSERVADRSTRTSSTSGDSVTGQDTVPAPPSRSTVPDSPRHTNPGSLPPIGIVVIDSLTRPCLTYDGQLTPGADLAVLDVPVMPSGAATVRAVVRSRLRIPTRHNSQLQLAGAMSRVAVAVHLLHVQRHGALWRASKAAACN